jgi:hypothetical protein
VFGVDDPKLRKALKSLSLRQAERTYCSNRGSSAIKCDKTLLDNDATALHKVGASSCVERYSQKSSSCQDLSATLYSEKKQRNSSKSRSTKGADQETLEQIIKYGRQFLEENTKNVNVDPQNLHHHTTSTQTLETSCVPNNNNTHKNHKDRRRSGKGSRHDNNDMMGGWEVNNHVVSYNNESLEPRPPEKKKPEIKKQMQVHRMNRLVGKR